VEAERHSDEVTKQLVEVVTCQNKEVLTNLADHTARLKIVEATAEDIKESLETLKNSMDEIRLQRATEKGMMKGWIAASAALGALFAWVLEHLNIKELFK
jgi:hypothetical protein